MESDNNRHEYRAVDSAKESMQFFDDKYGCATVLANVLIMPCGGICFFTLWLVAGWPIWAALVAAIPFGFGTSLLLGYGTIWAMRAVIKTIDKKLGVDGD